MNKLKDEAFFLKFTIANIFHDLAYFHSRHWEHSKNKNGGFSTYHSVYCHVQKPSWSYNIEKPVNVLKDCNHHFILVFRCWSTMTSKRCNIK